MPLARHHRKWETAGVIALLGLVGAAFAYALFAVMSPGPDPLANLTADTLPPEPAVERTMEARRQYQRSLSVHTAQDVVQLPSQAITRVEDYGSVGLDLPARPAAGIDDRPDVPAVPIAQQRDEGRRERTRESREPDRPGTGWGWLADDIAASRENRAATSAEQNDGMNRRVEQEGALEHRTMMDEARGSFDSSNFRQNSEEQTALRQVLRDDAPTTLVDPRRPEVDVSEWEMPGNSPTGRDADRAAIGFAGASLDAMLGLRTEAAAETSGFAGNRPSGNEPLYRIATVSDASAALWQSEAMASPWQGARSDGLFHSGGGYQPSAGMNASRSDGLFGAAQPLGGSLGSGASFGPSTPSRPDAGGIGRSSSSAALFSPPGSAGAGGGGFDSRWDSGRSTPSALPW